MKKIVLLSIALLVSIVSAHAQKISYQGEANLGYSVGIGDNSIDRVTLHVINGARFNDYLFMGIGVGVDYFCYYKKFMSEPTYTVPIFANIKGYLPVSKRVKPFLGLDLGYGIGVGEYSGKGGLLVTPALGVSFGVTDNFALNLSVGYSYQKMQKSTIFNDGAANAISIKVGFQF